MESFDKRDLNLPQALSYFIPQRESALAIAKPVRTGVVLLRRHTKILLNFIRESTSVEAYLYFI